MIAKRRSLLSLTSVGSASGASTSRAVRPRQPDAPVTSTRSSPSDCATSARAPALTNPVVLPLSATGYLRRLIILRRNISRTDAPMYLGNRFLNSSSCFMLRPLMSL